MTVNKIIEVRATLAMVLLVWLRAEAQRHEATWDSPDTDRLPWSSIIDRSNAKTGGACVIEVSGKKTG